jgi:hypothetical protein
LSSEPSRGTARAEVWDPSKPPPREDQGKQAPYMVPAWCTNITLTVNYLKNYNIFPLLKISYQLRIQIYLYYFLSKIVYHTVKFLWTLLQNFASSNNHQVV